MRDETKVIFKKGVVFKVIQAILILIFGSVLSWFLFQKADKEVAGILVKKKAVEKNQALTNMSIQLYKDYNVVQPYLDKVDHFLPTEDGLINILSHLDNMAETAGLTHQMRMTEIKPYGNDLEEAHYIIVLSGTYEKFLQYCQSFEKSPYFVRMNKITLSGSRGLDNPSKMTINISLFLKKTK